MYELCHSMGRFHELIILSEESLASFLAKKPSRFEEFERQSPCQWNGTSLSPCGLECRSLIPAIAPGDKWVDS
jgi:hypothetical protein